MNKKEIYEHLANIYLDASSKSTKKKHKFSAFSKSLQGFLLMGAVLVLGSGGWSAYSRLINRASTGEIALFLQQGTAKINFNFDPAKKENFSLNLKSLNLSKYKALGFSLKKTNSQGIISLRVELTNRFNEKSEIYVKNVSTKWANENLDFKSFTKINDWTQMKELTFSVEEWNVREKSGIVYLDNIRVIK